LDRLLEGRGLVEGWHWRGGCLGFERWYGKERFGELFSGFYNWVFIGIFGFMLRY